MHKIFAIFASALLLSVPLHAQDNVIDEVIWVVGEEAILKSDVEQSRLEAQSMGQRIDGDPYCVIPEQLAVQKLFLHQAAIDSVEVTDSEVLQDVERRINYYIQQIGSKEKMEEYFGKTTTQIREQLYDMVKNEYLISEVRRNLVKDIKVTPAQVRQYFKDVPEDSIPFIPTKYEVQLFVINPRISTEEINRVKDELREYTERVNSGQSQFSTLALMYSEDKESAAHGGELGFITRMDVVPEFANVAFNLTDPKIVSKIFESEYGFHIIQLIEKRGDRINVRHILKKPRVSNEELTEAIMHLDSIMMDVNDNKFTFEQAVSALSEDKDTRANYGIMVNKNRESDLYGTPKFELKDMPSEVAKTISNMNVGDMSKPFVMVNDKGKEVVAVAKLKSKVNGHRATMKDDYQDLQNVMIEKKSAEKIESWIREMQKKTYVKINKDWQNCEFNYPGWIK
ncbi:MAG: peptidylprolyl isomerase [Bacteroidaceae bacterium]|nr:peptidylprolyl isomerase [Bacteroidaceae bacterium]